MQRPPVGIADFARAIRILKPSLQDCLAIAETLGLKGTPASALPAAVEEVVEEPPPPPPVVPEVPHRREWTPPAPHYEPDPVRPPFRDFDWGPARRPPVGPERSLPTRLTELRSPPTGKMPAWVASAEVVTFATTPRTTKPPQPAVPKDQLRALVADLIKVPALAGPDIPRLIDQLARGLPVRTVPLETGEGTSRNMHVVVDNGGVMQLFQRDVEDLLGTLRRVARASISGVYSGTYQPPAGLPRIRSRGDLLLAISDLGMGSATPLDRDRLAMWATFASRQKRRGANMVAIVPFAPSRWPLRLKRGMRLVYLYGPGHAATATTGTSLTRLARVLSLAAVVDPAILRDARMRVLPRAGVGAEADFVCSPWVTGYNPRVIVINLPALVELRAGLGQDVPLLEDARALLLRSRRKTPDWARVVFEEQLTGVVLRAGEQDPEAAVGALARLIKSLSGKLADSETARWALHLVDALPVWTRETEAAELLKAVASSILGTDLEEVSRLVHKHNAGWIFGEPTPVGVAWTGRNILVREPPLPGDSLIGIPVNGPRIVIVSDRNESEHAVMRVFEAPAAPDSVWATQLPVFLTTSAGARYQFDSIVEEWQRIREAFRTGSSIAGTVGKRKNKRWVIDVGLEASLSERELMLAGVDVRTVRGKAIAVKIATLDEETRQFTVEMPARAGKGSSETWRMLADAFARQEQVTGTIVAGGSFGYSVKVGDLITYVPFAEFARSERDTKGAFLGRSLKFHIPEFSATEQKVVLSRLSEFATWQPFLAAREKDKPIAGTVVGLATGGFKIQAGERTAIVAFPDMDTRWRRKSFYSGKTFLFKVTELSWADRRIVLSRHQAQEGEVRDVPDPLISQLEPGRVVPVRVTRISDWAVFVDLGGVVGVIERKDLTWLSIRHPSQVVAVGDQFDAVILQINQQRQRVKLGLKQLSADPTPTIISALEIGAVHHGIVATIKDYGAFVDLGGINGLLHNTHLSWSTHRTASTMLKVGDELDVIILAFDPNDRKRITLGRKELLHNPWERLHDDLTVGEIVRGRVLELTRRGIVVSLADELDGLIDTYRAAGPTPDIARPADRLRSGDEVEVEILSMNAATQTIMLRLLRTLTT